MKLKYAILKYLPEVPGPNQINVGIAIHQIDQNFSHCYTIADLKRIQNVDTEINYDPEYYKAVLDSFHEVFDYQNGDDDPFNRFTEIESDQYLAHKTEPYINEFQFAPIQTLNFNDDDFENTIQNLIHHYL